MRLGRLVAAGLVAGAVAGFVGALLRPRTVLSYPSDTARPATDARGDLAAARSAAGPVVRSATTPVSAPAEGGGSAGYALATSAPDEATDDLPADLTADHLSDPATDPTRSLPTDGPSTGEPPTSEPTTGEPPTGGTTRTLDVDAVRARPRPAAPVAAAPSRGANG